MLDYWRLDYIVLQHIICVGVGVSVGLGAVTVTSTAVWVNGVTFRQNTFSSARYSACQPVWIVMTSAKATSSRRRNRCYGL